MHTTSLNDLHRELGASLVDFAGWEMPIRYGSIRTEHQAVREAAGLFDLGHMARIDISGPNAVEFLEGLATNSVAALETGQAHYSLLCNERGTILDDVIYYRLADRIFLVANASNRGKVVDWLQAHAGEGVTVEDRSDALDMLAIQGPKAAAITARALDCAAAIETLPYYAIVEVPFAGTKLLLARTGYTGEDGFEVYLPRPHGVALWQALSAAGADDGLVPVGLGARDTLRLEAAMPLYGHEIDETTNPLEAGLSFAVKLKKPFIGRDALAAVKKDKPKRALVGFEVEGRRAPRQGYALYSGGEEVGVVTSGSLSPTLGRNIGLGYVPRKLRKAGTALEVDIRGNRAAARVIKKPFYKRARS